MVVGKTPRQPRELTNFAIVCVIVTVITGLFFAYVTAGTLW